jgi:hypothetical protein
MDSGFVLLEHPSFKFLRTLQKKAQVNPSCLSIILSFKFFRTFAETASQLWVTQFDHGHPQATGLDFISMICRQLDFKSVMEIGPLGPSIHSGLSILGSGF